MTDEQIFGQVIRLPADERAAFLASECKDQPERRTHLCPPNGLSVRRSPPVMTVLRQTNIRSHTNPGSGRVWEPAVGGRTLAHVFLRTAVGSGSSCVRATWTDSAGD